MNSKINILSQFDHEIPIPEHNVCIPWLITESELFEILPPCAFHTPAIEGWPILEFTLLGIKALFSLNFQAHPDGKLIKVGINDINETSICGNFQNYSAQLLEHLGPAENQYNLPNSQRWWNDRVTVKNAIISVQLGDSDQAVMMHAFDVLATFWVPPEERGKPRVRGH